MEPTANIKINGNAFEVTVGPGYYEIYIDKKPVYGYLRDGQSKEYTVTDGEHEIGVYSRGRFVAQENHVFGVAEVPAEAIEQKEDHAEDPQAAKEEPEIRHGLSSYEFEKAAKNAVIKIMKEKHGLDLTINELQFVWFAHELGYKKCTLYAEKLGHYYPEVTYNLAKNEMYVDIYLKQSNTCIPGEQMDFSAE